MGSATRALSAVTAGAGGGCAARGAAVGDVSGGLESFAAIVSAEGVVSFAEAVFGVLAAAAGRFGFVGVGVLAGGVGAAGIGASMESIVGGRAAAVTVSVTEIGGIAARVSLVARFRLMKSAPTTTISPVTAATPAIHRGRRREGGGIAGVRTAVVAAVPAVGVAIASRTLITWAADCGRSAGRLQRQSRTRAASIGGVAGRRRSTGSGSSMTCAAKIAWAVRPLKGGAPVSSSYAITPSA